MTTAKSTYHIVYDDGTVIAKFTASELSDVRKKYNKRCQELLRNAKDVPVKDSFGGLAWRGNLVKNHKPVELRLAKVTETGYSFENEIR